ncbi:hemerythrin [Terasakiella brassicae]|uniref:Hemerythrin n=1 Tax=Terasakiella brassicae TaxID=1634917 RepID=A0A917BVC6_9PROT|nr:bacteriohemerythrin [Terasakiella brassicae]GGF58763.1 hemerythrin [Terasakiella brassicae]
MKYKEWSDEFELGIGVIDEDHQMLFRTIRQLGEQIAGNRNVGVIEATIKSLGLYVEEHFDREERFMVRAGYPDFDAHKKEHDDFRDSVISLHNFHARCPQDVDAEKIVTFLEGWLLNHIAKVDRAYAPYLLGKKEGDPAIMQRRQQNAAKSMINISCPADKEEQVRHFISLISDASEEGQLVEAAVEKITETQIKRREAKAKSLFGR